MVKNGHDRIAETFADHDKMEALMRKASEEAITMHKRLGNPIAIWRDGKVVWLQPEEIPDFPADSNKSS